MAWLAALAAALPVIGKILDLFHKSPEAKLGDISKAILAYVEEIHEGVSKAKASGGDTSELEKALNRSR